MIRSGTRSLSALFFAAAMLLALPAQAAYPLSGRWTYDDVDSEGPAPKCSPRYMEFAGARRFDTEGSVRDYRNLQAQSAGTNAWRITDEFFNGQVRGRVIFTLTQRDDDHIEINMARGPSFRLRRCP